MGKLSQAHREAVKQFEAAGLPVKVEFNKKHVHFMLGRDCVFALSLGGKQNRRSDANLRRTIRGLKEGRMKGHDKRFNRD
jgi:hypothetical protein